MKGIALGLILILLLGCSKGENISSSVEVSEMPFSQQSHVDSLKDLVIDPPYSFNVDEITIDYFGDFFKGEYQTQKSSYLIGEGTLWENEVIKLVGEQTGARVYVIASVHGDEAAAYIAANMLKDISISAGELYILSPANPWGVNKNPPSRYVMGNEDLNRSFPGDLTLTGAKQVAATIFNDVKSLNPDFVIDLHEAQIIANNRDFLGSSLIFTNLYGYEDMFFNIIMDSQMGEICSESLDYFSPGPEGSVNKTITQELLIPVITVETFRGYEMETRVADQLAIVERILQRLKLV